eukprot:TRINITY_DN2690_c0_g1_i2.p1 TRINITY_DN2690_c0_g1~~TRINITY_DN2690_c0_g1_i2.p1  ORF type:complete len:220 (-),score=45.00 TRINITY_DN2690_c0_g1_i2:126-785(-)
MFYVATAKTNSAFIDQLKRCDIFSSSRVEQAMRETDRRIYSKTVDYQDRPEPIGYNATISAPHMHAQCLEWLEDHLQPGMKVLDVGCGSGYLSAAFSRMVGPEGKVIGIDYLPELVEMSKKNIEEDDPELLKSGRITLLQGDGWKGVPDEAPFDCIHVGAAAATFPQALIDQIKNGGRMIIPVGEFDQYIYQIDKSTDGEVSKKKLHGVRYVPLVKLGK